MKIYSYTEKIVCKKCSYSYKPTAKICRRCKTGTCFRNRKKLKK